MIDTSMKYIGLYDNHWRVRIKVRDKPSINIIFNFNRYGGKKNALILARKCRNDTLKKLNQLFRLNYIKSPDIYADERKINPIIGVYMTFTQTGVNWTARCSIKGEEIKKHFSINKYGEKTAFLKACGVRFKHSGKLFIINRDALPCLPVNKHTFRKHEA